VDDLYEIRRDRSEKSFRYPLYERWLFLVGIIVAVAALIVQDRLGELMVESKAKGIGIVAGIALFVLMTFWISFRGWKSKILLTHKSIKAWYFWQGFSRISWQHIKDVHYSWRPLGHRLTFVGSDGATVSYRSSIGDYDLLMDYVRANAPEHIVHELDEIFGDYEDDEVEDDEELDEDEEDEEDENDLDDEERD